MGSPEAEPTIFTAKSYMHLRHPRLRTLRSHETRHAPGKLSTQWLYEGSGPIHIPGVYDGRDKTFFHFFVLPRFNDQRAPRTGYVYPTAEIRSGDLNQIVQQQKVVPKNPFTGEPFPNNIIPSNMLSPAALAAFNYMPMPNFGPAGNLVDNFLGFQFGTIKEKHWHVRFDHAVTDTNTVSFNHYGYNRKGLEGSTTQPLSGYDDTNATRQWSIQDSHMFSPNVINEFQVGRNRQGYIIKLGTVEGNALLQEFGIDTGGRPTPPGVGAPQLYTQVWGFQPGALLGSFSVGEVTQPLYGSVGPDRSSDNPSVWMLKDAVSVNRGSHLMKFGIDLNWGAALGQRGQFRILGQVRVHRQLQRKRHGRLSLGPALEDQDRNLPIGRLRPGFRLRLLRPGRLEGHAPVDHDLWCTLPALRRPYREKRPLLQFRFRELSGCCSR